MLEEVWPEIGNVWVSGVLAGGGTILVQWLMPKAARLLGRLRDAEHPPLERRLAAILAADVAGYSRLMSADEECTHTRLLAYRREVIEPKVRQHRGRIVKHTGDGALVEFRSVVGAVRCALEVQKLLAARNAKVPQNRRIEFRIGVNLGGRRRVRRSGRASAQKHRRSGACLCRCSGGMRGVENESEAGLSGGRVVGSRPGHRGREA
jgi:hypothetical protein